MPTREREARVLCEIRFRKASAGESEDTTSDVEVLAYTGGLIDVGYGPEVLDLSGLDVPASFPLLVDHNAQRVAGWSSAVLNDGKSLVVPGKLLVGEGEDEGRRVRSRAKAGYPWQASMGWSVLEDEYVPAGQSRTVNGQLLAGPFLHDKRTRLGETSFVSRGADGNTRVKAAAAAHKEKSMADTTDGVAQERARVKALRAAFPDDRAFADEHEEAGSTLEQAKLAYADRAAGEVKKLRAEKAAAEKAAAEAAAKLEAEKKAKAPSPTLVPALRPSSDTGASDDRDASGTALDKFRAKVREARASGLSPEEATRRVARDNPDLHRDVLAQANPGKPEPAYRAGRK